MRIHEIKTELGTAKGHVAEFRRMVKASDSTNDCYLVVMFGRRQYQPSQVSELSIDLFAVRSNFAKPNDGALADYGRYRSLKEQRDGVKEKSKGKLSKEASKTVHVFEQEMATIESRLRQELDAADFVRPQFELRFSHVDVDAIQEIKNHPVIAAVGKTETSPASIRVVVG